MNYSKKMVSPSIDKKDYYFLGWLQKKKVHKNKRIGILGNPGATSRDDAIFSGESLLNVLKSPWELILTEPVPEVVEFRSADWAEKYFSAQSAELYG